jgi:hypothetical protein
MGREIESRQGIEGGNFFLKKTEKMTAAMMYTCNHHEDER